MAYKVAVPSYRRHDTIMDKTLATLRRGGVAISDIYVFVVDAEKELYQTACPGYQIIVGRLGLVQQRAFIQNFFSENDTIVMMDDDITEIYRPIDSKTKEQILDLPGLFHLMKIRMISENVSIAGIYPCNNLKFALGNKEITTDFRYLVGAFYLIKNLRMPDVQLDSSDPASHEDKIRTIKYYQKEGKTLRFSWVQIKTKYFGKGGLDSPDRLKQHKAEAEALVTRFPQYLRLQKSKKLTDCKFRRVKKA